MKDFNEKLETTKLYIFLEERIGQNSMILVWKSVFLFIVDNYSLRSRMNKVKRIDKYNHIELKTFCITKWAVNHEKKTERTADYISKHLILQGDKSTIYKKLYTAIQTLNKSKTK